MYKSILISTFLSVPNWPFNGKNSESDYGKYPGKHLENDTLKIVGTLN
jgi:hypothetical protein